MKHPTITALAKITPIAPLLAVLAGCASYQLAQPSEAPIQPFGAADSRAATVCVIRPSHWALTTTFVVHDDDQLVGATRGESYFCYLAQPGPHRIISAAVDTPNDTAFVTMHAEAGHRYWLHQGYDSFFGSQLEWLDESRARAMIDGCDYKELVETPDGETLPRGVPIAPALSPPALAAQ